MTTLQLDRPTPFLDLVAVEARKLLDTRGARGLVGLMGLLSVLGMLVPLLNRGIPQRTSAYLQAAEIGPSLLAPAVVVLLVTGEWTHRTAYATFVQEPRRHLVLAAKAVVATGFGVAVAVALVVVAGLGVAVSALLGRDVALGVAPAPALGLVLSLCLSLLAAVALAALLQSTAAAIAACFVLPVVVALLYPLLGPVGPYVDLARAGELVRLGQWNGHVTTVVCAHALWLGLAGVAGVRRWGRRDVG